MENQPDLNELQPLARVIAEKIRTVPVRHCAGGTEDLIAALTLAVAIYVSREVLPPGLPGAVAVPAPAPDDRALRHERYATAMDAVTTGHVTDLLDAILAVADAEQAELRHSRSAILREEATRIDETRAPFPVAVQNGITWATAEMRRHAAECPQCGSTGACNGGPCPLAAAASVSGPDGAAVETEQCPHWLSDSARIGRALIWTWTDIGEGAYGKGYRDAQAQARALLGGKPGGEEQQDETRRCVCGDPIEWMDHADDPGWIHSPGSDTPCLNAREARQDQMQARPPRTEWQIEFDWRGDWQPDGPAWAQRDDAATRYASTTARPGGRAQRLVQQETTYTVVAEYQPSQEPTR